MKNNFDKPKVSKTPEENIIVDKDKTTIIVDKDDGLGFKCETCARDDCDGRCARLR